MKISDMGEFGFIRKVSEKFRANLEPGIVGIGDDCAVIPQGERSLLITTDMLVEDVHFLRDVISPLDLGHKSLAVNLSDIAAMGGISKYAFLSIGLPESIELSWADSFLEGFNSLAKEFNVILLGGDTTRSPGPIIINVSILGEARSDQIKLRSGARAGDIICVTGYLGDSAGGLKAILEKKTIDADVQYLFTQHHRPAPQLIEGQWLASNSWVHAMMDVSDGINSDLKRIIESSKCGASIDLKDLPISPTLTRVSKNFGWNALEMAAIGGEDYCLLITVEQSSFEKLSIEYERRFHSKLYPIGKITDRIGQLDYKKNGQPYSLETEGFHHFGKEV